MSGVYIPNLEKPECCAYCPMFNSEYDFCQLTETNVPNSGVTVDWCPLFAVPDHGRPGDLDDVINDVRHYLCEGCGDYFGPDAKTESCDYCRGTMLIKAIERKSSIIPTDKEGEG